MVPADESSATLQVKKKKKVEDHLFGFNAQLAARPVVDDGSPLTMVTCVSPPL